MVTPTLLVWAREEAGYTAEEAATLAQVPLEKLLAWEASGDSQPSLRQAEKLAKLKGWTVVTHETPARSKKHALRSHFIPDVCLAEKVQRIDLLELMQRENWSFT